MGTIVLHREPTASRRPRVFHQRSFAVDAAIALSSAAALAHAASTSSHYSWWVLSGEFFAFLAVAQGALAYRLYRKAMSDAALKVAVWGTVAVVAVYVVSRTVGIPFAPEIAGHGGAALPGRSIVPGAASRSRRRDTPGSAGRRRGSCGKRGSGRGRSSLWRESRQRRTTPPSPAERDRSCA
jgi:hypothetical protein